MRQVFHRLIKATIALFNRNPWTVDQLALVSRLPTYAEDGLRTVHNHDFIRDADFERAYGRGVLAGGWDYGIRWRVEVMLWAAANAYRVPGAFVECGTGRGFMASAICESLCWTDRRFYLFDTFEPRQIDPASGERLGTESDVYANDAWAVRDNFREWPGVELVVGKIPETLHSVRIESVAFLHVDLNHAEPEAAAVRHFWPLLSPGAIVVFDDYGYQGYAAIHESAKELAKELGVPILALPTGQGLAIKG